MTTYAQQSPDRPLPSGTFTIRPCDWAEKLKPRPVADVVVGLRLPSDEDEEYAKRQAREYSEKRPDELPRWQRICVVARAICDKNNASEIHEAFQAPEEQIPEELKPETIVAMFDELERLSIANSPIRPKATDDEILELMGLLSDGDLHLMTEVDTVRADRARRYMRYVLDELTES